MKPTVYGSSVMKTGPRIVISDSDQAVAKRLIEARKSLGLSQSDIAKKIQIPKERLASYEYARAPIKADAALKFCERLNVSEEWLATGRGYFQPSVSWCFKVNVLNQINPGEPYCSAFKRVLQPEYHAYFRFSSLEELVQFKFGPDRSKDAERFARFVIDTCLEWIPEHLVGEFAASTLASCIEFMHEHEIIFTPLNNDQVGQRIRGRPVKADRT